MKSIAIPGAVWHVTIAAKPGVHPRFEPRHLCASMMTTFEDQCEKSGALLHLGCLMPTHAHLLVEIRDANLVELVSAVKSRTARNWWEHGGVGSPWQRSSMTAVSERRGSSISGFLHSGQSRRCRPGGFVDAYPYFTGLAIGDSCVVTLNHVAAVACFRRVRPQGIAATGRLRSTG